MKDEIRVRAPQHFRGPSIAYADRHNHIGNTAPGTMPLFEDLDVDSETGEVREPKSR